MLLATIHRPLLAAAAVAAVFAATGCDPPASDFAVSPGTHQAGDTVGFELPKSCSFGGDRDVSWDFDGDGKFDPKTSAPCFQATRASHVYDKPGTYDVTDDVSQQTIFIAIIHGYTTRQVTIAPRPTAPVDQPPAAPPPNQAPQAGYTTDADPAYTERPVHFDASASSDSDGQIVKYEWDFDSDGTYDATGATASHAYDFAGTYEATLRVTDDDGATATTKRAISVVDGVPPDDSFAGEGGITAARRGTPFSAALSAKLVAPGQTFINGGTLFQAGLTARGSLKLSGLPAPLQRKKTARWAAGFVVKQHGSTADATIAVDGYMLLDFGHRDRVCFNGRVSGTLSSQFTGRLAVVGGSGVGGHVRGAATLAVPQGAKQINGVLDLRSTRKARSLPKACKTLVRTLR